MAEPQSMSQKVGLTRGKAAMIGVLAVALVGVVYFQYGSTDDYGEIAVAYESPVVPVTQPDTTQAMPEPSATAEAPVPLADAMPSEPLVALAANFDAAKWESPELAKVVNYDPFAVPDAFPQAVQTAVDLQSVGDGSEDTDAEEAAAKLAEAVESLQSELRAMQERGVHVIVRKGNNEYVAMIGDRMIHVGDEIENGFTVTAIEPNGVRIERKLNP